MVSGPTRVAVQISVGLMVQKVVRPVEPPRQFEALLDGHRSSIDRTTAREGYIHTIGGLGLAVSDDPPANPGAAPVIAAICPEQPGLARRYERAAGPRTAEGIIGACL